MKQNSSKIAVTMELCKVLFLSAALFTLYSTSAYADCPDVKEIHPKGAGWVTDSGWKDHSKNYKGGAVKDPGKHPGSWQFWQVIFKGEPLVNKEGKIEGKIVECQYNVNSNSGHVSMMPPTEDSASIRGSDTAVQRFDETKKMWFRIPGGGSGPGVSYACTGSAGPCNFEITSNGSANAIRNSPFER